MPHPIITTQPSGQIVGEGKNAIFKVTATNASHYQWSKNGVKIIGATSNSYTTPPVTQSDNDAIFRVMVSNHLYNVISSGAKLTVKLAPPSITTQSENQTVTEGQTATFNIVAVGSSPLSYQWNKNNIPIYGATNSLYNTPITTMGDNGAIFNVTISNSAGKITSNNVTLTINPVSSGNKIFATGVSLSEIQLAIDSANDNDTVVVPSGIATWSNQLNISKSITVQGATTVDSTIGGLPFASPYPSLPYSAATDKTIITRDDANGGTSVVINASSGKRIRFSGFTFLPGTSQSANGCINVNGFLMDDPMSSGNPGVRIDNCHFQNVGAGKVLHTFGSVFGVIDHCLMEVKGTATFLIWHESYLEPSGSGIRTNGEGSWADDANWGSYKFWFFEDNIVRTIDTTVSPPLYNGISSAIDAKRGARYVVRHNRFFDFRGHSSHGTEEANPPVAERGVRAIENYRNVYYNSNAHSGTGEMRSGNVLYHDNNYFGQLGGNGSPLTPYREDVAWKGFGGAQGSNPWDKNDIVDQTGNHFGSGSNGLYGSGQSAIASGGATNKNDVVLTAQGTPNWIPNQWVGFHLTNLDQTVTQKGLSYNSGRIISNTANTITTAGIPTATFQPALIWNPGDRFEIRRIIFTLDQSGRGKGDYISYANHINAGNTIGGTSIWPNQVSEPSYSWNNKLNEMVNSVLNCQSGYPTIQSGGVAAYDPIKSYYLRAPQLGDPANSYPYTEFTYPHPLQNLS